MSDQPTPETPERDSWRKLAEDAVAFADDDDVWDDAYAQPMDLINELALRRAELVARLGALLAVEDKHPPVFHIRPTWVVQRGAYRKECQSDAEAFGIAQDYGYPSTAITKEWRWGIHGANGEPILPESETLKNRVDALEQAHRLADPLGARVLDDEGNEV